MSDDQLASTSRKVLVNLTTLKVGGALQVATSLVLHARGDPDAERWVFAISPAVAAELSQFGIDTNRAPFHLFENSPARHRSARRQLQAFEQQIDPELVFTLFGPAYVCFRAAHLCGVADPWLTHSTRQPFATLGTVGAQLKRIGSILWKAVWIRQADYWWTETEMSKGGLVHRLRFRPERVSVIPNTIGPHFYGAPPAPRHSPGDCLSILCLSAYYPHKNLEILPDVALELQRLKPDLHFEFVTTISNAHPQLPSILGKAARLGVGKRIRNIGSVRVADVPELYSNSHLSFLPSVLETYSAVYAESLAMGVPLVVTDADFARRICGDAASYFRPMDAQDAARAILQLVDDASRVEKLTLLGKNMTDGLPSPHEKWLIQKSLVARLCDSRE